MTKKSSLFWNNFFDGVDASGSFLVGKNNLKMSDVTSISPLLAKVSTRCVEKLSQQSRKPQ